MKKLNKIFCVKNVRLAEPVETNLTYEEAKAYAERLNDAYEMHFGGRPFHEAVMPNHK